MAILNEDTIYSCPHCGSEQVQVTLFCWVDANNQDHVDIDWQSDVGVSTKWYCNDCENSNFLPNEKATD